MALSRSVSVVVPAYNEAETIEECARAIVAQLGDNDEIIVVDNNSSDGTVKKAQAVVGSRGRVIHEAQQGLVYARNAGMNAARGEIIVRVDADTIIQDGWLEAVRTAFEDTAVWATTGPVRYYDMPRGIGQWILDEVILRRLVYVGWRSRTLYGCHHAMRASTWRAIMSRVHMRRDILEDVDMSLAITSQGGRIAHTSAMRAEASGRRTLADARKRWQYNTMLPRTYRVNGRLFVSSMMWILTIGGTVLQYVTTPLLRKITAAKTHGRSLLP